MGEFDGMSLDEIKQTLATASPEGISATAQSFDDIATHLMDVVTSLNNAKSGLSSWQGAAKDAASATFDKVASQAQTIAQNVCKPMSSTVKQVASQVQQYQKEMNGIQQPTKPGGFTGWLENTFTNDYQNAVNAATQKAVGVMNKVGSTYNNAAQTMNNLATNSQRGSSFSPTSGSTSNGAYDLSGSGGVANGYSGYSPTGGAYTPGGGGASNTRVSAYNANSHEGGAIHGGQQVVTSTNNTNQLADFHVNTSTPPPPTTTTNIVPNPQPNPTPPPITTAPYSITPEPTPTPTPTPGPSGGPDQVKVTTNGEPVGEGPGGGPIENTDVGIYGGKQVNRPVGEGPDGVPVGITSEDGVVGGTPVAGGEGAGGMGGMGGMGMGGGLGGGLGGQRSQAPAYLREEREYWDGNADDREVPDDGIVLGGDHTGAEAGLPLAEIGKIRQSRTGQGGQQRRSAPNYLRQDQDYWDGGAARRAGGVPDDGIIVGGNHIGPNAGAPRQTPRGGQQPEGQKRDSARRYSRQDKEHWAGDKKNVVPPVVQ